MLFSICSFGLLPLSHQTIYYEVSARSLPGGAAVRPCQTATRVAGSAGRQGYRGIDGCGTSPQPSMQKPHRSRRYASENGREVGTDDILEALRTVPKMYSRCRVTPPMLRPDWQIPEESFHTVQSVYATTGVSFGSEGIFSYSGNSFGLEGIFSHSGVFSRPNDSPMTELFSSSVRYSTM